MFLQVLLAALIPVAMTSTVSSTASKIGDTFTFRTTQDVRVEDSTLRAGSIGHGVVTAVERAKKTQRGTITLEPQYIELPGGKRLAVESADPNSTTFAGRAHYFPMPVPFMGAFIISGVRNPGHDVTIGPGTEFDVVPSYSDNQ